IPVSQIAGAQPAVCSKRFLSLFGWFVITEHDIVAPDQNFPFFSCRQILALLVDNPGLYAGGPTDTAYLALCRIIWIAEYGRCRFCHSHGLDNADASFFLE